MIQIPNPQSSKGGLLISDIDVERALCRKSFYHYVKTFWSEVIQEQPIWNWHIKYLCKEVQKVVETAMAGKPKRYDLVINVPPGTTKSTLFSIMLGNWTWTRMLTFKTLGASHGDDLGQDFSRKARQLVESDKHQRYFPEIQLSKTQNTKTYFVNDDGGWRRYCTVGGKSPLGTHAHLHVVDDPLDPQSVRSDADIKRAINFHKEVLPQRKVKQDLTPLILVMQRLHQQDPSGWRLAQKDKIGKVKHICLPAELDSALRPKKLRKKYVQGLLDPVRMNKEVLEEKKGLGAFLYAGQYRQNPVPLEGGLFKVVELMKRIEQPPNDFVDFVRHWDKAATKDDGDYTVGLLLGRRIINKLPQYWVLDVRRGQWSTDERENVIKATAIADGKKVKISHEQEPGSGGKDSAYATTKNLAGFIVSSKPSTGSKTDRAEPFATQVNVGNVFLAKAEWNAEYLTELEHFPDSIYDDQVDASSGAFNHMMRKKTVGSLFRDRR